MAIKEQQHDLTHRYFDGILLSNGLSRIGPHTSCYDNVTTTNKVTTTTTRQDDKEWAEKKKNPLEQQTPLLTRHPHPSR